MSGATSSRTKRAKRSESARLSDAFCGNRAQMVEEAAGAFKNAPLHKSSKAGRKLPVPQYDGTLPIHAAREEIEHTIRQHPVVVLAGETGSGKTTQLPKFLVSLGCGANGLIGCTQPRRVAALAVSDRIAEELGVEVGGTVGAKIRFTDRTGPETAIKLMTDGILLNEIERNPLLSDYEVLVIDEAHERSLNIDFILGHLRTLIEKRKDLKVIITSATIDTDRFSAAFNGAPIIEVSGRTFPVTTHYRPYEESDTNDHYLTAAVDLVQEILETKGPGDLLVFLPTERDIHELRDLLSETRASRCDLLPLFGRLTNAEQQAIFKPGGRRRIILSTNIAETSLTVPGIRYVIDTGLARISRYSPFTRTLRLPVEPVAQSSAKQRKGRCGRVAEGECFRLYSEEDFLARP
ncbi:MAG: DEAD/DEAH box helicase, partial [Puniceicoccaceae bacterium]